MNNNSTGLAFFITALGLKFYQFAGCSSFNKLGIGIGVADIGDDGGLPVFFACLGNWFDLAFRHIGFKRMVPIVLIILILAFFFTAAGDE